MQLIEITLPKEHTIFFHGDTHDGSANRHKEGQLALIERVRKEKNSRLIHMGDAIEGITVDDKRYLQESVDTKTNVPLLQAKNVVREYAPIKDKMITGLYGNHEHSIIRFGNVMKDIICDGLDIPFGTFSCVITVKDPQGKQQYKIYAAHGRKGIGSASEDPKRRRANMEYQLKKHLYKKMADCLIMAKGHTHKLIISEPESDLQIVSDGRKLKQTYTRNPGNVREIPPDLRWYLNTGTYRGLYGELGILDYGELAEYDPVELGCIAMHMEGGEVVKAEKIIV